MFKVIDIKDKKYIFLTNTLNLFRYKKEIMEEYQKIENEEFKKESNDYNIIKKYVDSENERIGRYNEIKSSYYAANEVTISGCDINLLYECNLRCRYCFVHDNNENIGGILSKENAKKILDYIFQHLSTKNYVIITLMGGEPLMNIGVFKEILDYANLLGVEHKKEVQFITTTNAVLLDEEKIALLEAYNVGFIMSLDSHNKKINDYLRGGYSTDTSVYEKVIDIIECIKDRIDVHINVTITPINLDIYDTAVFLYEKGVKNIHFYLCDSEREEMAFTKDHIEKLKLQYDKICDYILRKIDEGIIITCQPLTEYMEKLNLKEPIFFPCSTLRNRVAFNDDGEIYPCIVLMDKDMSVGNIRTGMDYKKLSSLKDIIITEKKCESCWARYMCGGECLSGKLWNNKKQTGLRCDLKRHIFSLRLYMYDYIVTNNKKYTF